MYHVLEVCGRQSELPRVEMLQPSVRIHRHWWLLWRLANDTKTSLAISIDGNPSLQEELRKSISPAIHLLPALCEMSGKHWHLKTILVTISFRFTPPLVSILLSWFVLTFHWHWCQFIRQFGRMRCRACMAVSLQSSKTSSFVDNTTRQTWFVSSMGNSWTLPVSFIELMWWWTWDFEGWSTDYHDQAAAICSTRPERFIVILWGILFNIAECKANCLLICCGNHVLLL